jgi:hypothetical protein
LRFQPGQVVLLVSRLHPEMGGVYEVEEVQPGDSNTELVRDNSPYAGEVYRLKGLDGLWAEHAIQEVNDV